MNPVPPIVDGPPSRPTTPRPLIALAWLVVGVPAAWGVSQTVRTATALFRPADAPAPAATPAAAPATGPAPTAPAAATQPTSVR